MTVLVDTNLLVAAAVRNDINHVRAAAALRILQNERKIAAAPVLAELFYLVGNHANYGAAVQAVRMARQLFQIEALVIADMIRMEMIMEQYRDARFDYADTAIMALAERFNITQVYTFDRRDFSIFRPIHCPALDLLP